MKNLGYLITTEETPMLEFTKENLDLIAVTRPQMTEFIVLKDLHTGRLVLDNYIVTELPYIGCVSFIVYDMIEMGTDKFFDYVNRIIPRSLMTHSIISEICGNKFTHKLYSDEEYKPIVIKEGKVEYLLFDKSRDIRRKAEEKVIPFLTEVNTSVLAKKGLFQEIATLKIVGVYLQSKDATIRKKARSELIRIFNLAK